MAIYERYASCPHFTHTLQCTLILPPVQMNILISDQHVPQLSDFGLSSLVDDLTQDDPGFMYADTTTGNRGGNARWLAPELLGGVSFDVDDDDDQRPRLTKMTDVYSFGILMIEVSVLFFAHDLDLSTDTYPQVFTGLHPFAHIKNDIAIPMLVLDRHRPPQPKADHLGYTDDMWEVTCRCWRERPDRRPSASKVVASLKEAIEDAEWVGGSV